MSQHFTNIVSCNIRTTYVLVKNTLIMLKYRIHNRKQNMLPCISRFARILVSVQGAVKRHSNISVPPYCSLYPRLPQTTGATRKYYTIQSGHRRASCRMLTPESTIKKSSPIRWLVLMNLSRTSRSFPSPPQKSVCPILPRPYSSTTQTAGWFVCVERPIDSESIK